MSSSRSKNNDDNTTKGEGTAAEGGGGGSSLSGAAKKENKNKNETSKGTKARVKKGRPKEAPVSNFEDLIMHGVNNLMMHGVKPWDSDADDFYESLIRERRKIDKCQDQDDSSPSPKEKPLSKFEDSLSSEAKNKNKIEVAKEITTRVKKQRPREAPVSKYEDLIMHGVKPWDSDADEFYECLLKERREIDKCQDQDDSSPSPREERLSNFEGNSEAKNKNEAPKGKRNRVKKERPREAPYSKYEDLRMHGVKPWDSDADDFYEALLQERREIDKCQDQDDSSPSPKEKSLSGFEGSSISGAMNESLKETSTPVREAPVSKSDDLIMHGVKPWDSDAEDFYESLQESRRRLDIWPDKNSSPLRKESLLSKFQDYDADDFYEARGEIDPYYHAAVSEDSGIDPCQGEDYEINPCQDEDTGNDPSHYEDSGINPYQDEDSGDDPNHDEDSGVNPSQAEDSGINPFQAEDSGVDPSHDEDSGINACQHEDSHHDEDCRIDQSQDEDSGINQSQDQNSGINPCQDEDSGNDEDSGINPSKDEDSCHDEDSGIEPSQDEDSGFDAYQEEDSGLDAYQDEDSDIDPDGDSDYEEYQDEDSDY